MAYKENNKENSSLNINNLNIATDSPLKPKSVNKLIQMNRLYDATQAEENDDSFLAMEKMCNETISNPNKTTFRYLHEQATPSHAKTNENLQNTMMDAENMLAEGLADDSFIVLEKMCNKTISDPNTTIFRYMHSESKQEFLDDMKTDSIEANSLSASFDTTNNIFSSLLQENKSHSIENTEAAADPETKALRRLLDDFKIVEDSKSPFKFGGDITQLDNVEAPTQLWDSTLTEESILQTSPVKMVGLLRPSTIIEECGDDSYISSTNTSYCTASKATEISSLCYETANDTNFTNKTEKKVEKLLSLDDTNTDIESTTSSRYGLSHLFDDISHKNLSTTTEEFSKNISTSTDTSSKAESTQKVSNNQEEDVNFIDLNDTENLIDLEATFGMMNDLKKTNNDSYSDASIIELSSSDDDDNDVEKTPKKILNNAIKKERNSYDNIADYRLRNSLTLYGVDDNHSDESLTNQEKSLEFNDTIEEVDYMIKKGLEYMAAQKATEEKAKDKTSETFGIEMNRQNTFLLPKRIDEFYKFSTSPAKSSPAKFMPKTIYKSPSKFSPKSLTPTKPSRVTTKSPASILKMKSPAKPIIRTPTNSATKPKTPNRFAINMKPIPNMDIFKKPTMSSIPISTTTQFKRDRENFAHVVSPIGAYIKKTGQAPLITQMKTKNNVQDLLNATAFKELEKESRLCKPILHGDGIEAVNSPKIVGVPDKPISLPKKAYISSDFKHVVDARTPVTIPGGNKIHKYLDAATMPIVVCHEGKMKIGSELLGKTHGTITVAQNPSSIPQQRDKSLADLSVMSGDISLYTIKDAQKY